MITVKTPDLCDAYEDQIEAGKIRVLDSIFINYGGVDAFYVRL